MRFEVLGSLRVMAGHREAPLAIPAPRQRVVLAALLRRANQVVPVEELAELVWDGAPPKGAVATVQAYVMRLRRVLGGQAGGRIVTRAPGYVVELADEGELDAARLEVLCREAGAALRGGDWGTASARAAQALALWRGEPLVDVASQALRDLWLPRLEQLRVQVLEWSAEAGLHLGQHEQLIPQLRELTGCYPLRERFWAQLMLALARGGRQAESLQAYQDARTRLVGELGIEPGPGLQDLHQRILVGDPDLLASHTRGSAAAPGGAAVGGVPIWPRQLPPALPFFVGRQAELARLANWAERSGPSPAGTTILAISGTAGVGKTALALRLAHDAAERFADGQLYVNLNGFSISGRPCQPSTAIHGFLRALGVPARQIPARLDQQTAMYRSVLAGKQLLILLDNARDEEQVRPLLPGSPGCLVIVTSRRQLTGLAAADGAHQLRLELFTSSEGCELLARGLGSQRVGAEPQAAAELVERCAGLPLALSVVAARGVVSPWLALAGLADELRDVQARLDALDTGDIATSIRAAFAGSYRRLGTEAARMFRLLGLHPGPEISVRAAASMAGIPADQAQAGLAELARLNLVTEHAQDRFSCHDLLRAYAAEQGAAAEEEPERQAALHRMLDHYLHTAWQCAVLLEPARERVTAASPVAGVVPEQLADHSQALVWMETERAVLLAVADLAAAAGFHAHAWQLAWALAPFLFRRAYWQDCATMQAHALAAAGRLRDHQARAWALLNLGHLHAVRGDPSEANPPLRQALRLYRHLGDKDGQARVHTALAAALMRQHRDAAALRYAKRSLDLYDALGNPPGVCYVLGIAGWLHAQLADQEQGLDLGLRAIALHSELGGRYGEADAWMTVGHILYLMGRHSEAITCHQRSLQLYRELDAPQHQAVTLIELGDAQHAAGNIPNARQSWKHALSILDGIGLQDATHFHTELIRQELAHNHRT